MNADEHDLKTIYEIYLFSKRNIIWYLKSLATKHDKGQSEKKWVTPAERSTVDRQIQSRLNLSEKCDISNWYIAFCKQMEAGLYLPV